MKPCKCKDKQIWYGMMVYLDNKDEFYQKCPDCDGRIDMVETFNKQKCDQVLKEIKND